MPLPVIAHVVEDNLRHYLVIYEINEEEIIVAGPAEGIAFYEI